MSRPLDEAKLRSPVGCRQQIAGVGRRDFQIVRPVANEQTTRRYLSDRGDRIDRQHVAAQLLRREQLRVIADHAGYLDRMVEVLRGPAPGSQVRGRREGGDPPYALIVGRGREREGTAESESRERDLLFTALDPLKDSGQVSSPLRCRECPGAAADARQGAARDEPTRFVGQVFGQFGQETGGLATHAERARQSVHQYEDVPGDGSSVRRRDA